MTQHRTLVSVNAGDTPFCAYNGHRVELALDIASQYEYAYGVIVQYKHIDESWRIVTSREGLTWAQ